MEQLIIKKHAESNNWDFLESLEKQYSFGFNASTKSGKIIHETKKPISINIVVKNKTEFKINASRAMKNLQHKAYEGITVISNTSSGECYAPETGYFNRIEKDLPENAFEICYNTKQIEKVENLKQEYEQRQKDFKQMAEYFGITEYSMEERLFCRTLAYNQLSKLDGSKSVSFEEYPFINKSCQGGLMFAKKGTFKNCYKYDINSMYPYLMTEFSFPLIDGEIKTITELPKKFFGIVKLDIGKIDAKYENIFKQTKDNYYTNYHIELLKLLKIEFKVNQSNNNAIEYNNSVDGDDIFDYMEDLFKIRATGNKHAKSVMNVSWGVLTREKDYEIPLEDLDTSRMHNVVKIDIIRNVVLLKADEKPYKHVFGRMKPFLLSYVRLFFVKRILKKVIDAEHEIYQINTDGFISTIPEAEMNEIYDIGHKFGNLKIEASNKTIEIEHVRKMRIY